MATHESGDVDGALELLADDIRVTMPPQPMLFEGRDAIGGLMRNAAGDRASGGSSRSAPTARRRRRATAARPATTRSAPSRSTCCGWRTAGSRRSRRSGRSCSRPSAWPRRCDNTYDVKVLVTGSAGHLGEALMRTLPDAVGLDVAPVALHVRGRLGGRPRAGARRDGGRRRRRPRRHAAQAARRLPREAGLRRHQRHRHADAARGGGRRRRGPLRLHEHDERVRPRARPAARRARRVDHRGRRPRAAQRLRGDQDRRRGPVRAGPPRPRPAVPDPADLALLPRGRRPRRGPLRLRRRQPQGQRAALPPRRPRGRGGRPPARAGARAGDRLRPLHRQRHHAVRARGPGRAALRPRDRAAPPRARAGRTSTPSAAGGCSTRWTACT